ncbi:DUF4142 domain-containing protein [Azospirillum sp. TSO35-2]|uniref:DUF4142 domain-containing protein n=1 Tax=Azospirillum sp. TSO35-2 TaxID=716796 RepID=UPI000D6125F7|nr:DUF4142 domain-containing protein [Azospirillum sp. TSO35-2]PWC32842.1 hypothetical protein TSO352_19775 [Azospirillum sp. TSO35-2]
MRCIIAAAPIAAVLLSLPAAAQQAGNPAAMAPGTAQTSPGTPAPHEMNQQDRLFIELATAGGLAEVDFGTLVGKKAGSNAVKGFAARMVEDHAKANQKLEALAKAGQVPQPKDLDAEHKDLRGQLDKASGADFERLYILGQIRDHQKTAQLLEWEIGSGQDPALKDFAMETLPTVLDHLRAAQGIASQLTGQASLATAAPVSGAATPKP